MGLGLAGIGAAAGGVANGMDQGAKLGQLMQQLQSQGTSGSILQQLYGGGATQPPASPLGALSSFFSGAGNIGQNAPQVQTPPVQQDTSMPNPGQGLMAGAGAQPQTQAPQQPPAQVNPSSYAPQPQQAPQPGQAAPAFGQGAMSPALQKLALDTSATMPPQAVAHMLKASGGDPQKFEAVRRTFQEHLLKADPETYGKYAPIWQRQNAPQPQQQGQPQQGGQPQGQAPQQGQPQQGGGGRFMHSLMQIESAGKNIPSRVDPDVAGPGSKSQGYFQINTPTWRDFAQRAGVDTRQYPNAMSAPYPVQERVASVIPVSRFGPRTRRMLQQQFGAFDTHQTVGALNARFGGGGQGAGGGQQPQGGGQPPAAGQVQMMSLADIVQAAKRVNPNMKPADLMRAVSGLLPIMNAQAQQQYHAVNAQLSQQRLQETHDYHQESLGARRDHDEQAHEDKQAGLSERAKEFQQRQAGVSERFNAKLDMDEKKLAATNNRAERKNILAEANAKIREQLAAERNEIAAANVVGPDRDKLLAEARDRADEAMTRLEAAAAVKGVSDGGVSALPEGQPPRSATPGAVGGYPAPPAPPPVKTPEAEAAKAPQGGGPQQGQPQQGGQPQGGKPPTPEILAQAKQALAAGAPKDAIVRKLQELGYNAEGL